MLFKHIGFLRTSEWDPRKGRTEQRERKKQLKKFSF